jgi:hypothetical protein
VAPPFVSPSPIGNAQKSLSQERDRWFESGSLQRRVRKLSVPLGDDASLQPTGLMIRDAEPCSEWPACGRYALRHPPDEVGDPAAHRLEPAFRHGVALDREGLDRLGEALE